MEIRYVRNLSGSHMVIKQAEAEMNWEKEMLLQNPLKELLVPDMVSENGEEVLWYDITGRQALDVILDTEEMDYETLRQLCGAVVAAAEKLEGLLLSPDAILLKPECIFIENHKNTVCLCYYPGNPVGIGDGFHELMQYLLRKINHRDRAVVEAGYRLFEETAKEGYSITELLRLMTGGNFREEETILVQETVSLPLSEKDERKSGQSEIPETAYQIKVKEKNKHISMIGKLQKWLLRKREELVRYLPGKKKKEEEVFVFEPEEVEDIRESRPTVLLSEISLTPQGILKYEGEGNCSDLRIEDTPYIIGSDGACDGVIRSDIVSRRHAKITKAEEVYFIEDLNSSNGTYVGGELLNCRVKMSLQRNEIVLLGNEKFRFI